MGYNVFAVTPATNSDDRKDATGAFIPGAQRLAHAYGGSFKTFDNAGADTKAKFLQTIKDGPGALDMFAYFGHGWTTQLGSAKIYTEQDIDDLAEVLQGKLNQDATVVLYACWAGSAGGFSTKLQEKIGCGVWSMDIRARDIPSPILMSAKCSQPAALHSPSCSRVI
jgi:hypothetical protein